MNRATVSLVVVSLLILSGVPMGVSDADYDHTAVPIEIPESYDMREYYDVGPMQDQGRYGLCWAFAAMDAMESLKRLNGMNDIGSRLYFGEWTYTGYGTDYESGIKDEIRDVVPDKEILYSVGENGYDWISFTIFSNWFSPIDDSFLPYSTLPKDSKDLELQTLDPTLALNTNVHMTDAILLSIDKDLDEIKSMLLNGYMGGFAYAVDRPMRGNVDGYDTFMSEKGKSYNHEVALIGWDDNYPKENFVGDNKPTQNGAWLIKNSWGTNDTRNGYGWVSYECSVCDTVAFYIGLDKDVNKNLYSYDRCYSVQSDLPVEGDSFSMSNVFVADGNELLESVSFTTYNMRDVDYVVDIYLNPADPADPTSGTKVASRDGHMYYPGMHTVTLLDNVKLEKGAVFAVDVTISGNDLKVPLDCYEEFMFDGKCEYINDPVASPGQSFVNTGDGWYDISSDGSTNLRIKAVTIDEPSLLIPAIVVCILGLLVIGMAYYFTKKY